jgi:hypothetical protein
MKNQVLRDWYVVQMDEEVNQFVENKLRNKVPSKHWNLEFKILEFFM